VTEPPLASDAPLASQPPLKWYRRPLSFETQCWIAWTGLLAFGLRGVLVYRELGAYPPLELGAVVLAICWAIDLVRTRVQLARGRR